MTFIIARTDEEDPARTEFEDRLAELAAGRVEADVLIVPHIYHVAHNDPLWQNLCSIDGPMVVATWLYPRGAEWVLRSHGIGSAGVQTLNMADFGSPEECLDACEIGPGSGSVRDLSDRIEPRWYPVIDYSRCANCGQCRQFCLFDVYGEDEAGAIRAVAPDNCKDGCPACARVCPHGAIMFPLYLRDPAVAGAPGVIAEPDEAAKRLFEERTKTKHVGPNAALDDLIDDLEQLMEGN